MTEYEEDILKGFNNHKLVSFVSVKMIDQL